MTEGSDQLAQEGGTGETYSQSRKPNKAPASATAARMNNTVRNDTAAQQKTPIK